MANYQLFRQIAGAMAVGDTDRADELIPKIADDEEHEYHTYVTAVFSGFVSKYFEDDSSPEAVKRFVNEMRNDYRKMDPPLQALALEGLLRAFFGEDHFMDEIDPMVQLQLEFLSLRKMHFQSEHFKQNLDKYLVDAETIAIDWLNET